MSTTDTDTPSRGYREMSPSKDGAYLGDGNVVEGNIEQTVTDNRQQVFNVEANEQTQIDGIIKEVASSPKVANLGDGNVVEGNIGQTVTDNRQQVFNIHNTQKELSDDEKLRKKETDFRNACVTVYEDGRISEEAIRWLNARRDELGLNKDLAEKIQNEVREASIIKRTTLSQTGAIIIEQVFENIKNNNQTDIRNSYQSLEAAREQMNVPQLDQMFFQLKALFHSYAYISDLSAPHGESYWEVFWSYVAYIQERNPKKAEKELMSLCTWDRSFPSQNQVLLQTAGALMQGRINDALKLLESIKSGFSEELIPLYNSIRKLLAYSVANPKDDFYVDVLFRGAYEQMQKDKAARLAEEEDRRAKEKENEHKQQDFLRYYKKSGNEKEALLMSGATLSMLNEWKHNDDFVSEIESIERQITEREEDLKKAFLKSYESNNGSIMGALDQSGLKQSQIDNWIKSDSSFRTEKEKADARLEAIISKQKEQFISAYKSNKCDMQKACSNIELNPDIISHWRQSDATFDNRVSCIERDRRKDIIFRKVIPCIAIAILLVIIYFVGKPLVIERIEQKAADKEAQAIEKTRQKDIQEGYAILIDDFNIALSRVDRDAMPIDSFNDSLMRIEQILSEIKTIEVSNPTIIESRHSVLLGKALSMCEDLHSYFRDKATSAMSTEDLDIWIKKNKIVESAEQRLSLTNNEL